MNQMMQAVIEMADQTFQMNPGKDAFVMAGQTNLLGFADFADMEKLRQLFEAFDNQQRMLYLFDQCLQAQGVRIFIGEEAGLDALDQCSIVTAPYTVNGRVLGVLGVIGPTRMAYERVIPIVDVTAKMLTTALNSRH
jgi:heat-inducible transcriptional repressor